MKHTGTLLVVNDIDVSKKFYQELMSQKISMDLGMYVDFEGAFCLMAKETWAEHIGKNQAEIVFNSKNAELYFEDDDFEGFANNLRTMSNIEMVHDVKEFPWGQRSLRFCDPDKHIIEVAESMQDVAKRFLRQGLSVEETATRIMFPVEFVKTCVD